MAEHIQKTDTLNEGRVKLNKAIDDAESSKITSEQADVKATQALANSESTQTQLDTIVIDGDSSVEAAQARVAKDGETYETLKARLDAENTEVTQQLAEKPQIIHGRDVHAVVGESLYKRYEDVMSFRSDLEGLSTIRVATFNIQQATQKFYEIMPYVRNMVLKTKAHVVGMQEIGSNASYPFNNVYTNKVFNNAFFYKSIDTIRNGIGYEYGNGIISGLFLNDEGGKRFPMLDDTVEIRSYQRVVVKLKGKNISIYNMHLSSHPQNEIHNQLSILFNDVQGDPNENIILMGDFNIGAPESFDEFTDRGFKIANRQEFPTYKGSGAPIDNILISGNMSFGEKGMLITDDSVSDHNILYADIIF